MAKDVIITPANGTVDFLDATGNTDGIIQLDDSGNLKITNPGGDLTIGDVTSDLYIGDGTNSVDIIFEQNGAIRALTGKTLTLGQSDGYVNVNAAITFSKQLDIKTTASASKISIYNEDGTSPIADTFADSTTDKSYIYFTAGDSSNDPGYIMHETSDSENNEGVLHLCPSDDNSDGDYVSIHGTNDPDSIKLHTSGLIETPGSIVATGNITATSKAMRDFVVANTSTTGANTINLQTSNYFRHVLTGNTTFTFTNAPSSGTGQTFSLLILQDATGGRTVSWANTIYWAGGSAPPATTSANARDFWQFTTYDGGSTFWGTLSMKDVR